jgi:hypothetical protein
VTKAMAKVTKAMAKVMTGGTNERAKNVGEANEGEEGQCEDDDHGEGCR